MTWFIVLRSYHDYDGGSDTPLGITDDEEKAKATVAEWERRKARSIEVHKEFRAFQAAWDDANPRPPHANIASQPKLPHEGIPKKKMSTQQLADREAAKRAHEEKLATAHLPYKTWSEKRFEAGVEFMKRYTAQEIEDVGDHGYTHIHDDFSYEPIEVL